MASSGAEPKYLEPLLGVVFDLDGTLVVSRHDFTRMRKEVISIAEKYGVPPGKLTADQPIARITEAATSELEHAQVPEGVRFRFDAEVNRRIDEIELEALPRTVEREGAGRLLKRLTERGFRIGVLTRSSEHFCRSALVKTGLIDFLPYLRTRSAPGPTKPSPEALLMLLSEMGVPKDRALYVGDHLLDVECATRARIRFYGLLPPAPDNTGMTVERFRASGANAVAADLFELSRHLGVPIPRGAPLAANS
jgi:HAD superfamily hydrolase (TIGR01549 family)